MVNAAVDSRAAGLPAEMYSLDDDYRALMETNLLTVVAVTSAFMPLLIASRGRVVNTGCLTGLVDIPANAAYGASMSALVAWSESLRLNVAECIFMPFYAVNVTPEALRLWSICACVSTCVIKSVSTMSYTEA